MTASFACDVELGAGSWELGINPTTVAKWRKLQTVDYRKTGPTGPRSTVLPEAEEAAIVAFWRHTLLSPYGTALAYMPSIPYLTRSASHRYLQRHGISRLPNIEGDKPRRSKFKRYPNGPRPCPRTKYGCPLDKSFV